MKRVGGESDEVNFAAYAYFYDEIYSDKDYDFESEWLYQQLSNHTPSKRIRSHLDFGAGTGKHALRFANRGLSVTGVELSPEMISVAPKHPNLSMVQGDIRLFESSDRFDTCSAMFHVLSYMADLDEMASALKRAARHLRSGGVLIFDVWHTPAVEKLGLEVRIKRVSGSEFDIIRLSEPFKNIPNKQVTVKFTVFVAGKGKQEYRQFRESHVMRHFCEQEISTASQKAGLVIIDSFESFTGRPLGPETWSACYVAVKKRSAEAITL